MIQVNNVFYEIGEKKILSDISLSMEQGQMLAILGANGAGKSTLLKLMTGSLAVKCGSILLNDKPLGDYSIRELSKKRAVLSQVNPISFPFTAFEIVMLGRSPYLLDKQGQSNHQIVDEILTTLDAQHLKDRLFSTMSGGEQQRIHFARVLAQIWDQENPCLFLDEPTSALDLKQQLRILELAKKLVQERGYSLCMILHDLNMARHYADRVLLLKDGNISAYGEVKDVLVTQKIAHTFDITFEYADKYACR
jgi:heme transport system ATP-binding protein